MLVFGVGEVHGPGVLFALGEERFNLILLYAFWLGKGQSSSVYGSISAEFDPDTEVGQICGLFERYGG